jgi:hypothetical protein
VTVGEPEATELLKISISVVVTSELVYSAVAAYSLIGKFLDNC